MGSGASMISAETELSTFKEMQAKFEVLKTEGKTDEDIYAELKTLYNTSAGANGDAPVAAPPDTSNGDVEKPADVSDAAPAAAPEAEPPAGEATAVEASAPPAAAPAEGEATPAVAAEAPAAETPAAAEEAPAAAEEAPPAEAAVTAE